MTEIRAFRTGGVPSGIDVRGHSGYAEEGEDIVCSAVSVLVQALYIGLADIAGMDVESSVDGENAAICLKWRPTDETPERVLTEAIFRSLSETARAYGNYAQYVEVSL